MLLILIFPCTLLKPASVKLVNVAVQQQPATGCSDAELLRDYAEHGSDTAFSEIVARYNDMVYSAALRQTGNPALAEDIGQAVFIVLARKAGAIRPETILSGWLFRAVRYAAMDAMKTNRRRRERELATTEAAADDSPAKWEELSPLLDDGLASLAEKDRLAILLRYFDKRSWTEVGDALRMNENSARVRVTRALEKLRVWFSRRDVTCSAVSIGALLGAYAVQAAPALSPASPAATAIAISILKKWMIKKAVTAALLVALLFGIGGVGYFANQSIQSSRAAQRAADLRAINDATVTIDRTLYGDPNAFVGTIHFGPQHEQFRPIFLSYAESFVALRDELRVFPDRQVRYGAFRLALDHLLQHQPKPARTYVEGDRGGSAALRRCTIEYVRVNGNWKWDYFGALTPQQTAEQMNVLKAKTAVMKQLTAELRAKELTDHRQILKRLETE